MTRRTLHPLLQRAAALAILGVGLGLAGSSIATPLMEAIANRDAAQSRLARYEAALKQPTTQGAAYNPADLTASHIDHAEAQLALQAIVDRIARSAGVAVQSIQPMPAEHLGDIGRGVWVEMTFTSDLQALTDFLGALDAERPLALVRRLEVDRGEGSRPDVFMRTKVEIGQAWRPSGDDA